MKSMLSDPRRRNLAYLAGAAIVSILLALFALYEQSAQTSPPSSRSEVFPGLAARIHQVAHIHIVSNKGAFDVNFRPNRGAVAPWLIAQKSDYPASYQEVNKTLVGLAAMQVVEPKTDHPEWFHSIGLDDPAKGGDGVEISLSDDHGHELAHLIVGKSEDIGDPGGAVGLFVRKPGDNQSWLVRAEGEFDSDVNAWLDKSVLDLDQTRVQSTSVALSDGSSYEVQRDKPTDMHFKLASMPAGREMASDAAADGPAFALTGFTFDDVKPSREVDFTNSTRLTTKTFDGMTVTADVAHKGTEYWAQLDAMSQSGKPDIAKQARAIATRVNGWAFKLADYKGAQFTTPLESLLKPKGGAPAPGPAPMQIPMQQNP
ncbi:MAG TPA: DUF4340 domain-containing protein [Rhizomicrobium sp.]|nr:DUF4340 domain-containing protein [Rhizomicrobium sp.]